MEKTTMDNNQQTISIATTLPKNLYWRLPATEKTNFTLERLGKSVQRAFKKYKTKFPEFFKKNIDHEEIAT